MERREVVEGEVRRFVIVGGSEEDGSVGGRGDPRALRGLRGGVEGGGGERVRSSSLGRGDVVGSPLAFLSSSFEDRTASPTSPSPLVLSLSPPSILVLPRPPSNSSSSTDSATDFVFFLFLLLRNFLPPPALFNTPTTPPFHFPPRKRASSSFKAFSFIPAISTETVELREAEVARRFSRLERRERLLRRAMNLWERKPMEKMHEREKRRQESVRKASGWDEPRNRSTRNERGGTHVATVRTTRIASETVQAMMSGSSNASLVLPVFSQSRG